MAGVPDRPEFSRPVEIARLVAREQTIEIAADDDERAALAERFGLQAIHDLRGVVSIEPLAGGRRLGVRARIVADVVQNCVVTLEPVESSIDEQVEILFERTDGDAPADVLVEALDDAEPLVGEVLDVGELVATEMALALDPYPRTADAGAIGPGADSGEDSPRRNPFEKLRRLDDGG